MKANQVTITSQLLNYKKEVKNLDLINETFECGTSIFYFELTPGGKVKKDSVKFLSTKSDMQNCIAGA